MAFWREYFAQEQKNYEKILENSNTVFAGSFAGLADQFDMEKVVFAGFMDGINDSLKQGYEVEKLEEDSQISLDVDFEKLYFNMLEAKADWLYHLPEWDGVLPEDKRKEITKQWRLSKQAVSEKKPGRNDPCPCGSGKKYKKCCGK